MDLRYLWMSSERQVWPVLTSGHKALSHSRAMRGWDPEIPVWRFEGSWNKERQNLRERLSQTFLDRLNGKSPRSPVRVAIPPLIHEWEPRSRSRSPTLLSRKQPIEDDVDEFIGKRVANFFGKSVFFGSVAEKIRGAVLAKEVRTSTGFLQVVWKIV